MTSDRNRSTLVAGFSLIELAVALAVMAILLGTSLPLLGAAIDAQRRDEVRLELRDIADALADYYTDQAAFPPRLDDVAFLGPYLAPGVNATTIRDAFGGSVDYVYTQSSNPDVATVYSRGENGTDDGVANEEHKVLVYGATEGLRKTRARMRVIVEVLANHLEAGGTLTGNWATDRAAMGLGTVYATDGFGTDFTLDAATLTLRSAGPDRTAGNADDVTN